MAHCPLPDNPDLREQIQYYLPISIKLSLAGWSLGVLYYYSSLAYPHKAFLFHLHTVCAAALICLVVLSSLWSLRASATTTSPSDRHTLLNWHRSAMLMAVCLTVIVAMLMIMKKSWFGGMGLLLLERQPSYHSWTALVWILVVIPMLTFTGMVVHQVKPPRAVELVSNLCFGSLGAARKKLREVHRSSGLVAATVVLLVAAIGLSEKNDDPRKHALAWTLVGVWMLVISQKALTV